jgi:hypothetical protein
VYVFVCLCAKGQRCKRNHAAHAFCCFIFEETFQIANTTFQIAAHAFLLFYFCQSLSKLSRLERMTGMRICQRHYGLKNNQISRFRSLPNRQITLLI